MTPPRRRGSRGTGQGAVELPAVAPTGLTPYQGRLAAGETYDALELRDVDQGGVAAPDCVFLERALFGGRWDDARLAGSRLTECLWEGAAATAVDVSHGHWQDVVLRGCRWGVFDARSASWTRVGVLGGRWDYVNLRGAQLREVRIEGALIGDLDLAGATIRRVTVAGGRIDRLGLHEARLADVDLSATTLTRVDGLAGLAGAMLSGDQCRDLAEEFAVELGVRVLP